MKILAIGNSFSQDATRHLREVAASADVTFVPENADVSLVGVINKTADMLL